MISASLTSLLTQECKQTADTAISQNLTPLNPLVNLQKSSVLDQVQLKKQNRASLSLSADDLDQLTTQNYKQVSQPMTYRPPKQGYSTLPSSYRSSADNVNHQPISYRSTAEQVSQLENFRSSVKVNQPITFRSTYDQVNRAENYRSSAEQVNQPLTLRSSAEHLSQPMSSRSPASPVNKPSILLNVQKYQAVDQPKVNQQLTSRSASRSLSRSRSSSPITFTSCVKVQYKPKFEPLYGQNQFQNKSHLHQSQPGVPNMSQQMVQTCPCGNEVSFDLSRSKSAAAIMSNNNNNNGIFHATPFYEDDSYDAEDCKQTADTPPPRPPLPANYQSPYFLSLPRDWQGLTRSSSYSAMMC